ncbi:hypothetical protein [Haloarcula sp. Atlit-120R]|uniref:hypothetical protein n=1 Tax=Haloarcula sp. Atlit-120R TaxID=2282135 RepID=UPI000EF2726C|nr:hypothetical protein [Haloarcula sp. Atlit-120R]RLM32650.1 hypothetical protein DVK01_20475 [Haloarcula sp. Atlit-120R]
MTDLIDRATAEKERGLLEQDYAEPCPNCGGVVFEWWDSDTCRDCEGSSDESSTEQTRLVTDGGRQVLSADAVDAALGSAHSRVTYTNCSPGDPNYPFPDGGRHAFWADLMSGLEGRWDSIRAQDASEKNSEQKRLVTDGGTPDPDPDAFCIPTIAELDAMRAAANLSMKDLSECAGFVDNRWSHILNNDVNPHTRTVRAFLTTLQEFDGHTDTGDQGPDPSTSEMVEDDGPTEVDVDQIAARLDRLDPDAVGEDPAPPEPDDNLVTDGGQSIEDTDQATGRSQFDGPIEPSDYEAVRSRQCETCGKRTQHVARDGNLVCTEDHTTTDEGQQTLIPDGGQDLKSPAEKHLAGETEVTFQCGVAASNQFGPSDPEYCGHEPETIELDEPASVDENNRIHVPGRPVECPECGQPVEFEFNGVRVMFA